MHVWAIRGRAAAGDDSSVRGPSRRAVAVVRRASHGSSDTWIDQSDAQQEGGPRRQHPTRTKVPAWLVETSIRCQWGTLQWPYPLTGPRLPQRRPSCWRPVRLVAVGGLASTLAPAVAGTSGVQHGTGHRLIAGSGSAVVFVAWNRVPLPGSSPRHRDSNPNLLTMARAPAEPIRSPQPPCAPASGSGSGAEPQQVLRVLRA
jgi:hypothetical protein